MTKDLSKNKVEKRLNKKGNAIAKRNMMTTPRIKSTSKIIDSFINQGRKSLIESKER